MTRWVQQQLVDVRPAGGRRPRGRTGPLRAADARAVRRGHRGAARARRRRPGRGRPADRSRCRRRPRWCGRSDDGAVRVLRRRRAPRAGARRGRPTGSRRPTARSSISGDTRVCAEVERAGGRGADVLVHEACRTSALAPLIAGTTFETIFSYHADTVALGAMAARAGVPHVVLTHLIPPPDRPSDAEAFADDLRDGGYRGPHHGRRGPHDRRGRRRSARRHHHGRPLTGPVLSGARRPRPRRSAPRRPRRPRGSRPSWPAG